MALNSWIQTYQILTNDDCIPSLSSILIAVSNVVVIFDKLVIFVTILGPLWIKKPTRPVAAPTTIALWPQVWILVQILWFHHKITKVWKQAIKGQEISERIYEVVALPKMWMKKLEKFCPEVFSFIFWAMRQLCIFVLKFPDL